MQWIKEHLSVVSNIIQSKRSEFTFTNCFLICFVFYRCWFGKEPGKYIDYIYQGPVILVLLVSVYVGGRTLPSPTERRFDLWCSISAFMENKTQTRPNIFRCSLKWPQQITLQELKWVGFGWFFWFWAILSSSCCSAVCLCTRFWDVGRKNVQNQEMWYNICSPTWGSGQPQQFCHTCYLEKCNNHGEELHLAQSCPFSASPSLPCFCF